MAAQHRVAGSWETQGSGAGAHRRTQASAFRKQGRARRGVSQDKAAIGGAPAAVPEAVQVCPKLNRGLNERPVTCESLIHRDNKQIDKWDEEDPCFQRGATVQAAARGAAAWADIATKKRQQMRLLEEMSMRQVTCPVLECSSQRAYAVPGRKTQGKQSQGQWGQRAMCAQLCPPRKDTTPPVQNSGRARRTPIKSHGQTQSNTCQRGESCIIPKRECH